MAGEDEILFTGAYKGFSLGARFGLSGRKPGEVAAALSYVSASIEPHAFVFSGIDTEKIDGFAKPAGKGIGAVCSFLESLSPGGIRESLGKALPEPPLMSAAESYLFNRLLDRAGVAFKVQPSPDLKPSEEKIGDFIGFIGKYCDWIAIKKLGLENVQDYEVSAILAGINHTVVNKAFDFAGLKKDDALVNAIAGGRRRSLGNVALALRALEPKLTGGQEDAYLVCKVLETLGYKPYASPEMLTDAHPDIKPPKVKGRKPKG
jgi:hypothetical protein